MSYSDLPRPFFVLAPMDDVTDTVFRQVIATLPDPSHVNDMQGEAEQRKELYREYSERAAEGSTQQITTSTRRVGGSADKQAGAVRGSGASPDLFFTEFVNVDGLMSIGREHLLKKLRFAASEGRVVVQLWGLKPENFRSVAEQICDGTLYKELGLPDGVQFAGVDLNMGCPAKSEVHSGACAALIRPESRGLAEEIIAATREGIAGRLPLSVKTRVGFNEVDMSWVEFLLQQDLDMLTVHGRTRKQMSKVPADWALIGQVRQMRDDLGAKTLIVGNGDVLSRQQGEELAAQYQLDGIMIGRGVFHDPFVFLEDGPIKWAAYDKAARLDLYRRHVELFAATWREGERPVHTLNKFCKIYVNGFDGAKEMREQLMAATSPEELLSLLYTAQQTV